MPAAGMPKRAIARTDVVVGVVVGERGVWELVWGVVVVVGVVVVGVDLVI